MSRPEDGRARLSRFASVGLCPGCGYTLDDARVTDAELVCARCGANIPTQSGVVLALLDGASLRKHGSSSRLRRTTGWAAGIAADMDIKSTDYVSKYHRHTRASSGFLLRREHALDMMGSDPGRVLEPGCGPGVIAPVLAERDHDTHGVDLSAGQLRTAAEHDPRTLYVQGDLERLPYRSRTFDTVALLGVLEYVERPAAVMREMARVITEHGSLIVSVPNARGIPRLWTQYVYLPLTRLAKRSLGRRVPTYSRRLYSARTLAALLGEAGFSVDQSRFFDIVLAVPPLDRLLADRPPRLSGFLEARLRGMLRRVLSTQIIVRAHS